MGLPIQSDDRVAFAKARMAEMEREHERVLQEARAGRKEGKLSRGLVERIEACTPTQLKRVIALARENLRNYKKAPELWQVRVYGKLLKRAAYKNKLYTVEERNCGKANCTKCPHGLYFIAHQRDGLYCRPKSLPFSRLPKPIRITFGPFREEYMKKRSAERVRT